MNAAPHSPEPSAALTAELRALKEWANLTDAGLRLRCGEMTAQEIRSVRAVLSALRATVPKNQPDAAGEKSP